MNKVIIINGSARSHGNTDMLVEEVIVGAGGAADITVQALRSKRIGQCLGCYHCRTKSQCSQNDDMTQLHADIVISDILVLASPLYWCGVTGLMKTFIDRMFLYYHPRTRPLVAGKRAVILTTMNQTDVEHESEPMTESYKRFIACLGMELTGIHLFGGLMEKGSFQNRHDYIQRAQSIGKALGKMANQAL